MRTVQSLNDDWLFVHGDLADPGVMPAAGEPVCLPHTWNAIDGHDDHAIDVPVKDWSLGDLEKVPESRYDRGRYWYVRKLRVPGQWLQGERIYLEVPAASLEAEVFVNGSLAGRHAGGFSAFRVDMTELLERDRDNILAVAVSNLYSSAVYPQHADFTFYGGLYRGMKLVCVPSVHLDLDDCGGPGVVIDTRYDGTMGYIDVKASVQGSDPHYARSLYSVSYEVLSDSEEPIVSAVRPVDASAISLPIADPALWSPAHPHLYTVRTRLLRHNEVIDEVTLRTGIRSIACTPQDGFILNGEKLPLRGVCRHQDRLYQGNALSFEDHRQDAALIAEIGANAIRLAHYQQAGEFYDLCDLMGFVVWAEIPFITRMNEDPASHEQALHEMRELITQNRHHPCICFWGLSNEVLLGGKLSDTLVERHRELNALVKELDPSRLTTLAHVTQTPEDAPLHDITDVEAYNHYFGWYVGHREDNATWLDRYHADHPDRCLGISEYGCEGIICYHTDSPKARDYTEEYQALYHETLCQTFAERPWVWGSFVWNMFDFGAAGCNEGGVCGRNNKGLVTMDRKVRKDSFYIYQAYWTKAPMVHICSRRYYQRSQERIQVRIYSNQKTVALSVDGASLGSRKADPDHPHVFLFDVRLTPGLHTLRAEAGSVQDTILIEKVDTENPAYTAPARS